MKPLELREDLGRDAIAGQIHATRIEVQELGRSAPDDLRERIERLEAQVDALEAHVRDLRRPTIYRTPGIILKGVAD